MASSLASALLLSSPYANANANENAEVPEPSAETPAPELDFELGPPRFAFGLRFGYLFANPEGEIYDFLTERLTLDDSDFNGVVAQFDFAVRLHDRVDALVGFEYSGSETTSEYRDFVDELGAPIEQKTKLSQIPITVSLRLYPLPRGKRLGRFAYVPSRVTPYLGGGIGAVWYELKQSGDFVDFTDLVIFRDRFVSDGWAFTGHVFAGARVRVVRRIGVVLETRYAWAEADVGGSFVGFGKIGLDGLRVTAGIDFAF